MRASWSRMPWALGTRGSVLSMSPIARTNPFCSGDGRYAMVYNGEIYNFQPLRQDLIGAGVEFRTASDTEVLLNAFIHWGRDCLGRINGMFAFAIYDFRDLPVLWRSRSIRYQAIRLCRDGGSLIFASEVKAILKAVPGPLSARYAQGH